MNTHSLSSLATVNPACHLFDLNKTVTRFVAPRADAKSNQLDFIDLVNPMHVAHPWRENTTTVVNNNSTGRQAVEKNGH
jgi:hypothetical protein